MLRTIALSLLLLLSVGVMLPFANSAHGVRQNASLGQRRHHRYHSRAWWRRYRARLRQKRAAAALAHRNALLGLPQNIPLGDLARVTIPTAPLEPIDAALRNLAPATLPSASVALENLAPANLPLASAALANLAPANLPLANAAVANPAPANPAPANLPPAITAPANAKKNAELKPSIRDSVILPGQMNLSIVALSRPNPAFLTAREESRMLAGVAVADLRRLVIDKMVVAGGWVTNDFIREINGTRVFVVTARTPRDARSPEKTWAFYFTEAGGRIYGITTDTPVEFADRMTSEAERLINALRSNSQPGNR